jgi:hypothetical protein
MFVGINIFPDKNRNPRCQSKGVEQACNFIARKALQTGSAACWTQAPPWGTWHRISESKKDAAFAPRRRPSTLRVSFIKAPRELKALVDPDGLEKLSFNRLRLFLSG